MYKIIITLLLYCCATTCGAEVDNALLKKNLEAANLQIEVLKAQVEVMKSYQDKFLSTVYWSLGTVAALVVFLAGFNWFTNNRNAEKESALHKQMITNELSTIQNDLKKLISESLLENKKNQLAHLENLKENLRQSIQRDFERKLRSINKEVISLKRESIKERYSEALEKRVYSNAIRATCELLNLSLDDYDFQSNTSDALSMIETTLKKVKEEGRIATIKPQVIAELTTSLTPFEDKHSIVIKRIYQQLTEFN